MSWALVVDEDFEGGCLDDGVFKVLARAVRRVHVHNKEHVRVFDRLSGFVDVLLRDDDFVTALHPMEKVRKSVGRYHGNVETVVFEVMIKGQCATNGITVRIEMEDDSYLLRLLQCFIEELYILLFQC